jgi:hypothetical protein
MIWFTLKYLQVVKQVSSRLELDGNEVLLSILTASNLNQKPIIVFNFTTDLSKLGLTEYAAAIVISISGLARICNGHQAKIAFSVLRKVTMKQTSMRLC